MSFGQMGLKLPWLKITPLPPKNKLTQRAPDPRKITRVVMMEVCTFLGSLRGLEWVPAKRRCLVPGEHRDGAQSRPPVPLKGHIPVGKNTLGDDDASRWALHPIFTEEGSSLSGSFTR
jgi:hypothetical protein